MVFLAALLAFLCCAAAGAENYWEMYWAPGEAEVRLSSEEDAQITAIIEEALQRSAGTMARYGADHESDLETFYEGFLLMSPDGTPLTRGDTEYEDIGVYRWAVGLPDDQSVSRDEAWKILLKFLIDQQISSPEILVHYYPQISYETGNYSGNPVWRIILTCYDAVSSGLPMTPWEAAVYAHDGSICGYRELRLDY